MKLGNINQGTEVLVELEPGFDRSVSRSVQIFDTHLSVNCN